jgi:predicted permease
LTLLSSGVLALKSFLNLTQLDLGIQPENVLTFRLPVPDQRLKEPGQIESYYRQMLEKIGAAPGVKSVAVMTGLPGGRPEASTRFNIVGQPPPNPGEHPNSPLRLVTAEYVEILGIRFTKGRSINEQDRANSLHVAVVNETFVNRYFPGVDPLTQRIAINDAGQTPVEYQIVGVFHNVRAAGSREEYTEINVPFWQMPRPRASIVLKTDNDPRSYVRSITAAVNSVDPDMPLGGARTVDEIVNERLAIDRFSVVLFASFGTLGLLLAAVGIYGVMSFGVAQRTHEFGIRMALGAHRTRVMGLVLKEGTILAVVGALFGLIGVVVVRRAMQITLFGVPAIDFRAFGGMFLLLLIFAWVACLLPAWRASRVDPLDALRHH